jgi:hypothetical protein
MAEEPKSLADRAKNVMELMALAKKAQEADMSIEGISAKLNEAYLLFSGGVEGGIKSTKNYMQSEAFKLFQETFPQAELILNNAKSLYDSKVISAEQKEKVIAIGNAILSLPLKVVSGEISFDDASAEFKKQLAAVQLIVPNILKETLKTGAQEFINSKEFQQMKHEFFKATFPIGEVILDKAVSLFNSGIINKDQRDELSKIGENILSLPFDVISGKLTLEEALPKLKENINALEQFLKDNVDVKIACQVGIEVGGEILSNMHPLGKFVVNFAKIVAKEVSEGGPPKDLQSALTIGLKAIVACLGSLEGTLDKEASERPRVR